MTDAAIRLHDELMRLPLADRIEIANLLWNSMECDYWEAELERRSPEIDSGTAGGRPASEVFDELNRRYRDADQSVSSERSFRDAIAEWSKESL